MSEQMGIFELGHSKSQDKASRVRQNVQESSSPAASDQSEFKQVLHDKGKTTQGSSDEKTLHKALETQEKEAKVTEQNHLDIESDATNDVVDSSLLFMPITMQWTAGRQQAASANQSPTILPSAQLPSAQTNYLRLSQSGQVTTGLDQLLQHNAQAIPTVQLTSMMSEDKQLLMQLRENMNSGSFSLASGQGNGEAISLKQLLDNQGQQNNDDGLAKHSLSPLQQAMFNRGGNSSSTDFSQLLQGLSTGVMPKHVDVSGLSATNVDPSLQVVNQNTVASSADRAGSLVTTTPHANTTNQDMLLSTLVSPSLRAPEWGQAFREQVSWLTGQGVQLAHLQLDPPDLGPVEVKVNIHHDQANISFTSHHAPVRDAIEQQIARLREQLIQQGFTDVNVDVSGQDRQEHQGAMGRNGRDVEADWNHSSTAEDGMEVQAVVQPIIGGRVGGVDFYA
ncbi:flagellar hook-length control protein FliK [Zooshikella harenae]|uniref:Flagellar hook-length control protein FliK n=1 Tax=Zooshikella harenae TaxID=2827238 RepID=A0ABS5Z8U6_9GAMM|nr:flagellar hook-length control protein FliK [Zooshikella harenae]MBU2710467.1 flagellar hook-length control protein FliK [Zooshikella harenae]